MGDRRKGQPNIKVTFGPQLGPIELQFFETFTACMHILTDEIESGASDGFDKHTTAMAEMKIKGELYQIQVSFAKKKNFIPESGVVSE